MPSNLNIQSNLTELRVHGTSQLFLLQGQSQHHLPSALQHD
jgi:hypothetical protein